MTSFIERYGYKVNYFYSTYVKNLTNKTVKKQANKKTFSHCIPHHNTGGTRAVHLRFLFCSSPPLWRGYYISILLIPISLKLSPFHYAPQHHSPCRRHQTTTPLWGSEDERPFQVKGTVLRKQNRCESQRALCVRRCVKGKPLANQSEEWSVVTVSRRETSHTEQ